RRAAACRASHPGRRVCARPRARREADGGIVRCAGALGAFVRPASACANARRRLARRWRQRTDPAAADRRAHPADRRRRKLSHGRLEGRRRRDWRIWRRRIAVMILDPTTDAQCLGQLTQLARELAPTTLLHMIAARLGSPAAVTRWLHALPQSD